MTLAFRMQELLARLSHDKVKSPLATVFSGSSMTIKAAKCPSFCCQNSHNLCGGSDSGLPLALALFKSPSGGGLTKMGSVTF